MKYCEIYGSIRIWITKVLQHLQNCNRKAKYEYRMLQRKHESVMKFFMIVLQKYEVLQNMKVLRNPWKF